jgi:carboxypeptidase T
MIILLALLLGLAAPAGQVQAAGPKAGKGESYDVLTYWVGNVTTKEDRTAIAQTGADIIEIGTDYVIVNATAKEEKQIAKLGYPIYQVIRPEDFPTVDAAYHNYAEMVADIQQVAAVETADLVEVILQADCISAFPEKVISQLRGKEGAISSRTKHRKSTR